MFSGSLCATRPELNLVKVRVSVSLLLPQYRKMSNNLLFLGRAQILHADLALKYVEFLPNTDLTRGPSMPILTVPFE